MQADLTTQHFITETLGPDVDRNIIAYILKEPDPSPLALHRRPDAQTINRWLEQHRRESARESRGASRITSFHQHRLSTSVEPQHRVTTTLTTSKPARTLLATLQSAYTRRTQARVDVERQVYLRTIDSLIVAALHSDGTNGLRDFRNLMSIRRNPALAFGPLVETHAHMIQERLDQHIAAVIPQAKTFIITYYASLREQSQARLEGQQWFLDNGGTLDDFERLNPRKPWEPARYTRTPSHPKQEQGPETYPSLTLDADDVRRLHLLLSTSWIGDWLRQHFNETEIAEIIARTIQRYWTPMHKASLDPFIGLGAAAGKLVADGNRIGLDPQSFIDQAGARCLYVVYKENRTPHMLCIPQVERERQIELNRMVIQRRYELSTGKTVRPASEPKQQRIARSQEQQQKTTTRQAAQRDGIREAPAEKLADVKIAKERADKRNTIHRQGSLVAWRGRDKDSHRSGPSDGRGGSGRGGR